MSTPRLSLAGRRRPRPLTLNDRAVSYLSRFSQCANAVWVADNGRWLYGVWQIGACYKNDSTYYGAFPRTFLERVSALFPEIAPSPAARPRLWVNLRGVGHRTGSARN